LSVIKWSEILSSAVLDMQKQFQQVSASQIGQNSSGHVLYKATDAAN
jgi:hypothetical protein